MGVVSCAVGRQFAMFTCVCLLAACADSETRSTVSKNDLPATKYHRIAIFVENPNPMTPQPSPSLNVGNGQISLIIPAVSGSATDAEIEQKVLSALEKAGVVASSGSTLFKGQTLSNQAKVSIIQKGFDAVLYVAVLTNGMREERVAGAAHDGQFISFYGQSQPIDNYILSSFELKQDGSVWHNVPTFQAKCDLQDTKTNKIVWSSETIATGGTLVLLSHASDQIVGQLRADGAI
jgi:hypothetical protein